MSKCRSCGNEIVWIELANGKKMPCDPLVLTVITKGPHPVVAQGRESHFSTCPDAGKWRQG